MWRALLKACVAVIRVGICSTTCVTPVDRGQFVGQLLSIVVGPRLYTLEQLGCRITGDFLESCLLATEIERRWTRLELIKFIDPLSLLGRSNFIPDGLRVTCSNSCRLMVQAPLRLQ